MNTEVLLFVVFLVISAIYSSVGFGGGSSYLAILSLFLVSFFEIRSMALVLNLTVVSIGTILFIRHRVFQWRQYWPFLVLSTPMAFLGAQMRLSEQLFFIILGCLLFLSGVSMAVKFLKPRDRISEFGVIKKTAIGGSIGFISGLSGIGGGIYLSPLLNLMGWQDARKVAGLASIFILFNSLAGLIGLMIGGSFEVNGRLLLALVIAVAIGGTVGSMMSTRKLNTKYLGLLTAGLVTYVGLKLLFLHGYGLRI